MKTLQDSNIESIKKIIADSGISEVNKKICLKIAEISYEKGFSDGHSNALETVNRINSEMLKL